MKRKYLASYPQTIKFVLRPRAASPEMTTDAKETHLILRHTIEGDTHEVEDAEIAKINEEIEAAKTEFMASEFRERQEVICHVQMSQLFNEVMNAVRRKVVVFQRFEEKWFANLCHHLGEARGQELIKEIKGQATHEKIVVAMEQMAVCLELGQDQPNIDDIRRMLSAQTERARIAMTPHSQTPRTEMLTPPAPERAGPSGLKRSREGPIRVADDKNVSLINLSSFSYAKLVAILVD